MKKKFTCMYVCFVLGSGDFYLRFCFVLFCFVCFVCFTFKYISITSIKLCLGALELLRFVYIYYLLGHYLGFGIYCTSIIFTVYNL